MKNVGARRKRIFYLFHTKRVKQKEDEDEAFVMKLFDRKDEENREKLDYAKRNTLKWS
jgi:hypothetical protein